MGAFSHLPYRPCVGIMLLSKEGNVFVARRRDMQSEAWQMPQGGIDTGEDPQATALRELKEEIGTNNAEVIAEHEGWLRYDLPDALVPKIWKGQYRGQKQKWFLMRFLGTDSDINLETQEPEFLEWKWVRPEQVPTFIVPFKRALYEQVLQAFKPYLKS